MKRLVPVFLIIAFHVGGCALQSDLNTAQQRIEKLVAENNTLARRLAELEKKVAKREEDASALRRSFAQQDASFFTVRSEFREMKGDVEELGFRLEREKKWLRQRIKEMQAHLDSMEQKLQLQDARVSRIERFIGFEAEDKLKAHLNARLDKDKDIDKLSADELYTVSKAAFDQGDLDAALEGFRLFLKKFPDSDKADNAAFWIGEIYFTEQWYEKAILEYENVIKNYPNGDKVPAAYLKQGIAFSKLSEKATARLTLKTLMEKFPDSNEARMARQVLTEIQ